MKYVHDFTSNTAREGWENWPETLEAGVSDAMRRADEARATALDLKALSARLGHDRRPADVKRIPTWAWLAFAAAVGLAVGGIAALWGLT